MVLTKNLKISAINSQRVYVHYPMTSLSHDVGRRLRTQGLRNKFRFGVLSFELQVGFLKIRNNYCGVL